MLGAEAMAGTSKRGKVASKVARNGHGACPDSLKNVASSRAERCGGCSGLQVPNQEP